MFDMMFVLGELGVRDLIEYIAKVLVDFLDDVFVNELVGVQILVIELKVVKFDFGKVIGK